MKSISAFVLLALWASSTLAAPTSLAFAVSPDCEEVRSEQIHLALLASNLANVNTTRTPEGGPYRPYRIKSCAGGGCDADRDLAPVMRYLPGHPDADSNGYVAFPNVDRARDAATFNLIVTKLKLLARRNLCGANEISDKRSLLISYLPQETGVKTDVFTFDKHHRIVAWMRTDVEGRSTSLRLIEPQRKKKKR